MATVLERYLRDMSDIRASGAAADEVSFYPALTTLLGEVGRKLKPKVFCISQLKDAGAGHPDFGLYTANQLRKASTREPRPDQPPERGVIEVKPVADDLAGRHRPADIRDCRQHVAGWLCRRGGGALLQHSQDGQSRHPAGL